MIPQRIITNSLERRGKKKTREEVLDKLGYNDVGRGPHKVATTASEERLS